MKVVILVFCMWVMIGFGTRGVLAASGKCTVVKVNGTRMVIDCSKQTKGFSKGNQIKIKSDKKRAAQDN